MLVIHLALLILRIKQSNDHYNAFTRLNKAVSDGILFTMIRIKKKKTRSNILNVRYSCHGASVLFPVIFSYQCRRITQLELLSVIGRQEASSSPPKFH